MKFRYLPVVLSVALSLPLFAVEEMPPEIDSLFNRLQSEGKSASEILVELAGTGVELPFATSYSVANAVSIGLAVAYAQAGICLAADRPAAEQVGQAAVDSARAEARGAVEAAVVSTLGGFEDGICQQIEDERNTASQAFAASDGSGGAGGASGGGGAGEPPAITDDEDVSVSQ